MCNKTDSMMKAVLIQKIKARIAGSMIAAERAAAAGEHRIAEIFTLGIAAEEKQLAYWRANIINPAS